MPESDSVLVERIRRAGAIPIGKTNVSGVRDGLADLQHGLRHDAQSVRSHARPRADRAAGRPRRWRPACCRSPTAAISAARSAIPRTSTTSSRSGPASASCRVAPTPIPFVGVSTKGAMARSVADVAFGLSVIAGADARDPQSWESDPQSFAGSARSRLARHSRRVVARSWRPAARSARQEGSRSAAQDLRGSRLHRRRRVSRLRQRQRDLPDAAHVGELEHLQGSARAASIAVQARRGVGHRVGRASDRRRSRPRVDAAGPADRADARVPRRSTNS